MKFALYTSKAFKIILYAMALLSLVAVVIGILVLAGVRIGNVTPGQATVLVSICSLSAIIATVLATVHYKFDGNYLRIKVLWVDVLGGRIRIDKILNLVLSNGQLYISYLWKGADPVIAAIMINPKRYQQFKTTLLAQNPNVIYYEDKDESTDSKQ